MGKRPVKRKGSDLGAQVGGFGSHRHPIWTIASATSNIYRLCIFWEWYLYSTPHPNTTIGWEWAGGENLVPSAHPWAGMGSRCHFHLFLFFLTEIQPDVISLKWRATFINALQTEGRLTALEIPTRPSKWLDIGESGGHPRISYEGESRVEGLHILTSIIMIDY